VLSSDPFFGQPTFPDDAFKAMVVIFGVLDEMEKQK